jgi:predicted P-loop ATPase
MEAENVYDQSKNKNSIYDFIRKELEKYYIIKFNEIALEFEIYDNKSLEKISFNESSLLIHLNRENVKVSPQIIKTYLKSHFVKHFNPLIEYFEALDKWDGKDYIKQYASYVNTDDNALFYKHLKKWAVRAIKTIIHSDQINKHCLILANGDQHAGKSTYLENLCPKELKPYYYSNIGVSKDDRIKICKAIIANLEELDVMGKSDINSLKAIISQTAVNERLPYADKSTLMYRTCSFVGSTNRLEFLNDDTGSVRWIVFDVIGRLDFSYSKEFDIDDFWAQAYYIYKHKPEFKSDLSVEEVEENEKRNEKFTVQSVESEYVLRYYSQSDDLEDFRTATDVVTELSSLPQKLNRQKIGSSFKKYGFERIKHPKKQVYGYKAKPKFKGNPKSYIQ